MNIKPTNKDVLFGGRGKPFTNHQGNVIFRETVELSYEAYHNATTNGKKQIVKQVKEELESVGARFLQKKESNIAREMKKAAKKNSKSKGKKQNVILDAEWEIAHESITTGKINQRFTIKKHQEKASAVLSENKSKKRARSPTVAARKKSKTRPPLQASDTSTGFNAQCSFQLHPEGVSELPSQLLPLENSPLDVTNHAPAFFTSFDFLMQLEELLSSSGCASLPSDQMNYESRQSSSLYQPQDTDLLRQSAAQPSAGLGKAQQRPPAFQDMVRRLPYRRANGLDRDLVAQVQESPAGLEFQSGLPNNQLLIPLEVPSIDLAMNDSASSSNLFSSTDFLKHLGISHGSLGVSSMPFLPSDAVDRIMAHFQEPQTRPIPRTT